MRCLIVKLSSLGDLFHALPAVARIHEATGAEIDWVTNAAYARLVERFAPVRRVIAFPRHTLRRDGRAFWREVRADLYDVVLDMQGLLKSALTARLARAESRIGPSFHREGSALFYDVIAGPRNKNRHAVDENLDMLGPLGIAPGPVCFPVRWDLPAPLPPRPAIALLPCSRWITKNWPVEHFVALARMLNGEANVYLFGAPEDHAVCAQIAGAAGEGVTNLCGQTTILELGGWLSVMDLAITVDSGPMHIAAAAGTPVLALFGPTDPLRTGPYGAQNRVLMVEGLSCRPCYSRHCRLPKRDVRCLRALLPERVADAVRMMMGGG